MDTYSLLYDTDIEIIDEYCNSNSHHAANALVRKYRSFVYLTALRYLKDEYDADDISQEVFIKALNNLHKFKRNSSLKTWLYRITVNTSKNHLRKNKVKNLFSSISTNENLELLNDTFENPDKKIENEEFNQKFLLALSKLPEKQREVFALKYFEELTYDEISSMLNKSVGGLKANYHHAVKKLMEMMK